MNAPHLRLRSGASFENRKARAQLPVPGDQQRTARGVEGELDGGCLRRRDREHHGPDRDGALRRIAQLAFRDSRFPRDFLSAALASMAPLGISPQSLSLCPACVFSLLDSPSPKTELNTLEMPCLISLAVYPISCPIFLAASMARSVCSQLGKGKQISGGQDGAPPIDSPENQCDLCS